MSITVFYDNSFKDKLLEIWITHHYRQSVLCVSGDCVHVPFADIGEFFLFVSVLAPTSYNFSSVTFRHEIVIRQF